MWTLTPDDLSALHISLKVALTATAVSLPFALAIAYILSRYRFPGRTLLDSLVHLPLVLPPVVTGYLLLITLGRRAPVGVFLEENFGIVFSFRWTGAALAAAVMAFPLFVRAIRLSLDAVDQRFEQAAATLGANRFWVFTLVTLPLIVPGILAGAVLAFAKALGEFGATITFVSSIPGETRTVPAAIYGYTQTPGGDASALRLAALAALISLAALLISELMARSVAGRRSS